MKSTMKWLLFSGLFAISFTACKKNNNTGSSANPELTLSKATVKLGEPLYAATSNAGSQAVIKWSVTPAISTWISSANSKSVILFSNPGSYTVTASYFSDSASSTAYDSSSSPVAVSDSVYGDSAFHCDVIVDKPLQLDEQIILTPLAYTDTGMVLLAHTQNTYINSPNLGNVYPSFNGVDYTFTFTDVYEFPCLGDNGSAPATTVLSFGALLNGTHALIISLNGTSYQGTIIVTDTDFTITWPYTSGVTISPLHINKGS